MPRTIVLTPTLIALLAGLLTVADSQAADVDPGKTAGTLMLTNGWAKTKAAQTVVKQQNVNAPPLKDNDLVRGAHWLALMYQGQYDPALDSVKVYLAKYPTRLDPLRAEIWMRMVNQDYGKAIVTAQKLGEAIPLPKQGEELSAAAAAAGDAVLVFLGHVAGFLEGPANKANDAERQKFEAQLLARLSDAQQDNFRFAKQDVLSQFRRMQQQAGDLKQNAEQEKATPKPDKGTAKQDRQEQLYEKGKELSKEQAKLEADARKVADDLKRKMANLEQQAAPLQQEWRNLKNQLASLNNLIQQQEDQIKRLDQEAADPKNPQQQNARNAAGVARNQLQDARLRLNFTNNEIFRVEAAHQRLEQQGLIGQLQFQNEGQKLQAQQQELDQGMRKNDNLQRRMSHVKPPAEPDTRALENKATTLQRDALAFATYDQFPFEDLKGKLLKALK